MSILVSKSEKGIRLVGEDIISQEALGELYRRWENGTLVLGAIGPAGDESVATMVVILLEEK